MRRRSVALALAALTLPILVACGNSSGGTGASTGSEPSDSSGALSSASPSASVKVASKECVKTGYTVPTASKKPGTDPDISTPEGAPPCKLVVKDLTVGEGKAVTDTATTYDWNYDGVAWSTGEKFDSSIDPAFGHVSDTPFALNQVIPGWTEGLQGMKPGGRRLLVIPPDQGYGANGSGPKIGPNETLVFVVDLVGPHAG